MSARQLGLVLGLMFAAGCSPEAPPVADPGGDVQTPPPAATAQTPSVPAPQIEPQKPTTGGYAPPAPAGADQDTAAVAIQNLGGEVMRNNTPGNPIYGVRVTGKKPDVAALIVVLKPLAQLQELSLDRAELTDAELVPLGELTAITTLDLSGNELTDGGLAHLKPLTKLESLRISQNQLTDAGLVHLAGFKNLKKLFLGRNSITDEGLAHLKDLAELEELNLAGCSSVTDGAFAHLAKLPKLKEVWLTFTRVTDPAVAAFQQQRTGVKVEK
jgi:hypothetical protein